MPRKYQPVWDRIKKNGTATLEVLPALAARVKKAVIKEKHEDLGFKLMNDHDHFFLDITYDKVTKRMKFLLRQSIGIEGRKV